MEFLQRAFGELKDKIDQNVVDHKRITRINSHQPEDSLLEIKPAEDKLKSQKNKINTHRNLATGQSKLHLPLKSQQTFTAKDSNSEVSTRQNRIFTKRVSEHIPRPPRINKESTACTNDDTGERKKSETGKSVPNAVNNSHNGSKKNSYGTGSTISNNQMLKKPPFMGLLGTYDQQWLTHRQHAV